MMLFDQFDRQDILRAERGEDVRTLHGQFRVLAYHWLQVKRSFGRAVVDLFQPLTDWLNKVLK